MSDKDKLKKDDEEEEEDQGYSCSKCCAGYEMCIVWTCKCIYNSIVGIKDGILYCLACCWYPLKERCCSCCSNCDKSFNPHKDPYLDPYDTL